MSLISYLSNMTWDFNWWLVVWWGGIFIGLLHVPSILMRREARPKAALAWILGLVTLPGIGVFFWWMLGRSHLQRRKRRWTRSKAAMSESLTDVREAIDEHAELGGRPAIGDDGRAIAGVDQVVYLRKDAGIFPSTTANRVRICPSGADAFDAFEAAVRRAQDHIHFQFYIWKRDDVGRRFRDLLADKARQGVEVRVLYDAVGGSPVSRGFMEPLIEAGGQVEAFLPVVLFERQLRVNFRNHRKLIVVDGEVGFTGGVNIGQEYSQWLDSAFGLEGPVVLQLQEVFAEDWYFATGEDLGEPRYFLPTPADDDHRRSKDAGQRLSEQASADPDSLADDVIARVIASGPDQDDSVIEQVFFMAMTQAIERIYVTTPYFIPDQAMLMAIKTAAARGVDVRLLTPGTTDVRLAQAAGRSYYGELLDAGVRIFEYGAGVLHAKAMLVDHDSVIIGSANMDIRSFLLNFEVNAVLESSEVNAYMARLFTEHLAQSVEVDPTDYQDRSTSTRLIESTARLFSPLL